MKEVDSREVCNAEPSVRSPSDGVGGHRYADFAHTPAPWHVGEVTMVEVDTDDERPDPWHAYVHDDGCLEANVSSDRALADATLIAAAPVMFEALWMIVANTEADAIKHRDYEHLAKDICDCASAALKTATRP